MKHDATHGVRTVQNLILVFPPPPFSPWRGVGRSAGRATQDAVRLLEEKTPLLDEYFMIKLSREETSATVGCSNNKDNAAAAVDDADADADGACGVKSTSASGAAATAGEEGKGAQRALCISSLPLLLEGHTPVADGLPMFLLRLAAEVRRFRKHPTIVFRIPDRGE